MKLEGLTLRVYRYLLANRDTEIKQLDVAKKTNVSPQLVNKIFKSLSEKFILARIAKNRCIISNYSKLLLIYSFHNEIFSRGAVPFYCGVSVSDAEEYLKNSGILYALALHSAMNRRTGEARKIGKVYAYILKSSVDMVALTNHRNGNLILLPREKEDFYACGKIDGFRVTPLYQTIADLLNYGDYESARKLADRFELRI